ncbi:class I adenylate-forming enzyme family protein [uncultured Mycobacterium sp.]|uniref:class I adenylate-forming enzyme family protein n=1 Tax=uncultured Mycobacterium sp. TaxID=171292 RepID=UPI0035CC9528
MWFEQVLTRGNQRTPNQICLRDLRRDVTWEQLNREARALASVLRSSSRRADRVLLLSGSRVEVITAHFACALAGGIAMPVNSALADSELSYILDAMSPAVAVADARGRARLSALGSSLATVPIETVADLAVQPEVASSAGGVTDPVAIFHTSATTGRPKGVTVDQRYFQFQSLSWAAEFRAAPGSVFLNAASLFHGSVMFAFNCLAALGVVGILDSFTPRAFINAVRRWGVESTALVPAMITLLLQDREFASLKGGTLRSVISAGAPLPEHLPRQMHDALGVFPHTIFGITEAGHVLHRWPEDDRTHAGHDGGVCVGRPFPGYSVRVVRDDAKRAAAVVDEVGMIQVACDGLMQGYWRNGEATAETVKDGWLTTGDLGFQDNDGFIWVVDRRLDMIVRGGQNVYPAEIERVLRKSPQVRQVAVVAAPSDVWGQTPVAFIEGNAQGLDTSELLTLCATELASYKRPSGFIVVDQLPRNAIGKVLRTELRDRAASTRS